MYRLSLWLRGHPWVTDVLLILVLSTPPLVWSLPGFRPVWVQIVVHAWLVLPLLWRRRFPVAVAVIVLAAAWTQLLGRVWHLNMIEADLALVVMLYTLVVQGRQRSALIFAGGVAAAVTTWVVLWENPSINAVGIAAFGIVPTFAAAWAFGEFRRARARLAESERQAERRSERQAAVTDERARIARELHDVLAHSVTVMVVNAEGARLARHRDPEVVDRTLERISTTGRAALTELRRLLADESDEHDDARQPQPTLADLTRLVGRAGQGRPPITLDIEGDAEKLAAGVAVQAYRIVQEALTNVVKHAPADATTDVRVHIGPDTVRIDVTNSGGAAPRQAALPPSGRGLAGMRERVVMFGGTLDAGPTPDGGYRLSATVSA